MEKVPLTVIEGQRGSGKSTIFNQLVLNSPFYMAHVGVSVFLLTISLQGSDTMDSGCVVEALPSRNYEWLKAVAGRIVAYHCCAIQNVGYITY